MNVVFDAASIGDLDLIIRMASEKYAAAGCNFDESKGRIAIIQLIQNEQYGRLWLIKCEDEVIGYVLLTFGFILEFYGQHAVLDEIYVSPSHQGQGVGKAVIAFLEEYCRKAGMKALRLEVESSNTNARKLYRNANFHPHDRIVMTRVLE